MGAILGNPNTGHLQIGALEGRQLDWGVAAFSTTALTVNVPVHHQFVDCVMLSLAGAPAAGSEVVEVPIGAVAATTTFPEVVVGKTGTLGSIQFVDHTAFALDGTNYYKFKVVNKTTGLTVVDDTVAANSTFTGGTAITADTPIALTLTANVAVTKNDVLEITITKVGAPAAMAEASFVIAITTAGPSEALYATADASGKYTVNSGGTITISRKAVNPTSGLRFAYWITGW